MASVGWMTSQEGLLFSFHLPFPPAYLSSIYSVNLECVLLYLCMLLII